MDQHGCDGFRFAGACGGIKKKGGLDLGPWQAVFYCEFDGRRAKRLVIKVIGA